MCVVNILYGPDLNGFASQILKFSRSDGSDLQYVRSIGREGSEPGQFRYPQGLCVDGEQSLLFVADTGNGNAPSHPLSRAVPVDCNVRSRSHRPAFPLADRIQVFTSSGEFVRAFGTAGRHESAQSGEPCFQSPFDCGVSMGRVFITDGGHGI